MLRLPCEHTLCSECHEESQRRGSTCPLDEESFADNNIVHLDISEGYVLKHTVACGNAPNGCDFIGQASRLLDHYKQCTFHSVPCPRCQSLMLRTELVGHCKDGCSSASTTPVPVPNYITVNYDNLEITSRELKKEMLKISDDLTCLQISLNQCLQEVRTLEKNANRELKDATLKISDHLSGLNSSLEQSREDGREAARNSKEQLEAQSLRLSEQLVRIGTVFAAANKDLKVSVGDTMKTRLQELREQSEGIMNVTKCVSDCVLGFHGAKEFHWYFKGWEDFKKSVSKELKGTESPFMYVCGYNVCLHLEFLNPRNALFYMRIHPGVNDSKLEWPFNKTYTIGLIHPKDKTKRRIRKVDASKHSDFPSFQMQKQGAIFKFGMGILLDSFKKLEREGFVNDDSLHFFLQVEPYPSFPIGE